MLNIVTIKGPQRKTHITKGDRNKVTVCGRHLKRTQILSVSKGNIELCTCGKCIQIFNSNIEVFTED